MPIERKFCLLSFDYIFCVRKCVICSVVWCKGPEEFFYFGVSEYRPRTFSCFLCNWAGNYRRISRFKRPLFDMCLFVSIPLVLILHLRDMKPQFNLVQLIAGAGISAFWLHSFGQFRRAFCCTKLRFRHTFGCILFQISLVFNILMHVNELLSVQK